MSVNSLDVYWVPGHVKDYLRRLGFVLPLDDMEPWIRSWDDWMGARGDFYDYRDKDEDAKGRRVSIPFGRQDCTVFRKVMSAEDVIQDFAAARGDSMAGFRCSNAAVMDRVVLGLFCGGSYPSVVNRPMKYTADKNIHTVKVYFG